MRPNTKSVHVWCAEKGLELEPGVMPAPRKHSLCACWNDFTGKWEFGIHSGYRWDTIHNRDALPSGFKVYLLLVGVS